MVRKAWMRRMVAFIVAAVAYVGTYCVLSANGAWEWSQTGKVRYGFGFAATDVERWQPAWAKWEPFRSISGQDTSRGNLQGYLFSPLIRLDRAWVHPDTSLIPGAARAGKEK